MVIKMDRAYVICHMAVSLDGKIDGDFHEAEKSEKAGAYYYDVIFDLGSSMAGGRVTTRMYSPQPEVDYEKYKDVDVPEGTISYKTHRDITVWFMTGKADAPGKLRQVR